MKIPFKPGDQKTYNITVRPEDIARFESGTVHELYSTFSLGRDAEWCTRLFVLEMKEEDEEGIGTFLYIDHLSAAKIGTMVTIKGTFEEMKGNELVCSFEARTGNRILAKGKTGQKILKKEKLEKLLLSL